MWLEYHKKKKTNYSCTKLDIPLPFVKYVDNNLNMQKVIMAKFCNKAYESHYRLIQYFTMAIMFHYTLQILDGCVKLEQNNYEYIIAIRG